MMLAYGFALIATRMTALTVAAPIFGHRSVPVFVRLLLALFVSLAVAPLIFSDPRTIESVSQLSPNGLLPAVAQEAVTGALIGLGVLLIFSSAQMIGAIIGQLSGIQLDGLATADSCFGQVPASRLVAVVAAAAFVLIGGPERVLSTVLDSFSAVPVGRHVDKVAAIELLIQILGQSFELVVRAVAPAVATLLVSTFLVGFLSRTLPQLNLLQIGISSNIALMLIALFLTLGGCVWLFLDEMDAALITIKTGLESLQPRGTS